MINHYSVRSKEVAVMNINECFLNLSRSRDFSRQGLMRHHQRTALIATKIGKVTGLQEEELFELFQASIVVNQFRKYIP